MNDIHPCIGCGRTTTAKSQICSHCLGVGKWKSKASAVAAAGPFERTNHEEDHCYDENSMGPHTSDERSSYEWMDEADAYDY